MILTEKNCSMLPPTLETYQFEDFVVGPSNEEAFRRISDIAALWPNHEVSPMLMCGPRGVGKSHLLGSLLSQIRRRFSDANVAGLDPDRYMLDLCDSILTKGVGAFQAGYNNLDVFILERVEWLAGKRHIQADILHVFKKTIAKQGIVVIEATCLPRAAEGFTSEFIEFCKSCQKLQLPPPTLAEKRQIVLNKYRAIRRNGSPDKLADDVVNLIASQCNENVRDIENWVHTLICWNNLTQREATCDDFLRLKARA